MTIDTDPIAKALSDKMQELSDLHAKQTQRVVDMRTFLLQLLVVYQDPRSLPEALFEWVDEHKVRLLELTS